MNSIQRLKDQYYIETGITFDLVDHYLWTKRGTIRKRLVGMTSTQFQKWVFRDLEKMLCA